MTAPSVTYSAQAERQVDALLRHYDALDRIEAVRNLERALAEAEQRITREPGAGFAAPRPYPHLAARGEAWIKSGSYWIAYAVTGQLCIIGVFHETADIPHRRV